MGIIKSFGTGGVKERKADRTNSFAATLQPLARTASQKPQQQTIPGERGQAVVQFQAKR